MAGNPCEEISPTGGKKKRKRKRKTEPDLTALFSGSLRIKSSQLIHHKFFFFFVYIMQKQTIANSGVPV